MPLAPVTRRALLLAAAAAPLAAAPAGLPIEPDAGRCVVTVSLDGHPARMLLDTGTERSVLSRPAMLRLGLQPDPWVGTTLRGAAGRLERHANAMVANATIGATRLTQRDPAGTLTLSVTGAELPGMDGLLGADILRHLTLYLDFPRARLLLFPPTAQVRSGLPLQPFRAGLLLAQVTLDSQPLIALIDTGSSTSLLNARGLHRMGISADRLQNDHLATAITLDRGLTARAHRFTRLQLGPITLPQPDIMAADIPDPAYDIVLGLDLLGTRPFLLSYAALRLAFNAA